MFTLKHFVIFFIVQNAVCSPHNLIRTLWFPSLNSEIIYSEETEYSDAEYSDEDSEINSNELCLEKDYSLISYNDMKYLIEDKADKLQIKDNLLNSYYDNAMEIFVKYNEELEEFREKLEDRPEHMLHILNDMASSRQKLEPNVEEIAVRLEEFDTLEHKYNEIKERADNMLNQLDKYKNICEINCGHHDIENRFGIKLVNNHFLVSRSTVNNNTYCVRLKDLNDYINEELSQFEVQYGIFIKSMLEIRDRIYAQKLSELKINLKEAAVKKFGMTMYDILSLQDDYHHFIKYLKNINVSSELDNIEENAAETKLRLIGLKRDVEKYRQYCMKCNINPRVKRNVFNLRELQANITKQKIIERKFDVVDRLIEAKREEIRKNINNDLSDMFEEIEEEFNDPNIIDVYVTKLQPIQNEIENDIKIEQEALNKLNNRIPEDSILKILELSEKSKQMIQDLESAKQFIDKFVP